MLDADDGAGAVLENMVVVVVVVVLVLVLVFVKGGCAVAFAPCEASSRCGASASIGWFWGMLGERGD